LLSAASITCDPRIPLEDDGSLAMRNECVVLLRAQGRGLRASRAESGLLIKLENALEERLRKDGHGALADAVHRARIAENEAFEALAGANEQAVPPIPPPGALGYVPPPEVLARIAVGDALAQAHPADVLVRALLARLRAEGRDVLAGSIMAFWAQDVAGPIVDAARLVPFLIARLRLEDRPELADEIMAVWLAEVAGPILDAGPLAAAALALLRRERREELAHAVAALLRPPGL
jgi:hypothetical protein